MSTFQAELAQAHFKRNLRQSQKHLHSTFERLLTSRAMTYVLSPHFSHPVLSSVIQRLAQAPRFGYAARWPPTPGRSWPILRTGGRTGCPACWGQGGSPPAWTAAGCSRGFVAAGPSAPVHAGPWGTRRRPGELGTPRRSTSCTAEQTCTRKPILSCLTFKMKPCTLSKRNRLTF